MSNVILKADGKPYKTQLSAARQLSTKGLQDTHTVMPNKTDGYFDGYCIAPKQTVVAPERELTPCEKLGYKAGDLFEATKYNRYFSAGSIAEFTGEYGVLGNPRMKLVSGRCDLKNGPNGSRGCYEPIDNFKPIANESCSTQHGDAEMNDDEALSHALAAKNKIEAIKRHRVHFKSSLSNAKDWANENWIDPAEKKQEQHDTVIATLHLARERKEQAWAAYIEAERAHELAVDAVNAELQGFYRLQEQDGKQPAESPELKDLPPEEWKAGDLVECIDEDSTGNQIEYFSNGKQYPVLANDGTSSFNYLSNDGEGHYAYNSCFRFIRRP